LPGSRFSGAAQADPVEIVSPPGLGVDCLGADEWISLRLSRGVTGREQGCRCERMPVA
jgi:hypothetical protein